MYLIIPSSACYPNVSKNYVIVVFGYAGETVALLKSEVKSQEKHVEGLKKRSLWSRTLEEVFFIFNIPLRRLCNRR